MTVHLSLTELTPDALRLLTGGDNRILRRIEAHFGVHVLGHVGDWHVEGARAEAAADVLLRLAAKAQHGRLDDMDVEAMLKVEDAETLAADDAAGSLGEQAHDRERGDALAAAGFADQTDRLAVGDVEGDAVDRADLTVAGEE